ncbi:hypothetical protein FW781_21785 [Chryseobacterium panacisoli]|uniref:Uncharacterized protein n=1 Tax=Chryseobacterium panacisoli TaxID=1807141 RepID=A0A5D8ZBY3_9FLAO|nr:hypothetical protein [Chryseobacterium panacisoli]TZF92369.1 hypothetical protein FW781_21785 [Chryseobacterium panacisoli]
MRTLCLLLISNWLFAQSVSINAKQLSLSKILVSIKNTSQTETIKLVADNRALVYSCDYKNRWPSLSNFARLAICFEYPKNYDYQSNIVPMRQREKMYGINQDLSASEYIAQNIVEIKPLEKKEIIYNVSDFNNSLVFKKKKKFTVRPKIIYFGEHIEKYRNSSEIKEKYFNKNISSNTFDLNTYFFKP